jgi:hypothetical protein
MSKQNILDVNEEYFLLCLFKSLFNDKSYLATVTSAFESGYFDDIHNTELFEKIKINFEKYNTLPDKEIILNQISAENREAVEVLFRDIDSTEFDIVKNYDWLLETSNTYLQDRAIKRGLVKAVDVVSEGGNIQEIRKIIEDSLCKNMVIDLGLNYWGQLGERLKRIFTATDSKVPTYYPLLDEYLNGGFPPFTLSMFVAQIHGFKSNIMANIISRQVEQGHNIALASLEMSQDMFAQRFDSIYSNLDINRMYIRKSLKERLLTTLFEKKKSPTRGELFIKNFPTGNASTADYRVWLRELKMRGIKIDAFYFDYINLMKSEYGDTGQMYNDVKKISEQARALGLEFDFPVISVSQLNRGGTFLSLIDVDMNSIAECLHPSTLVKKWDGSKYIDTPINNIKQNDIIKGSRNGVVVKKVFKKQRKKLYKIITKSGKEIICSAEHKFPTDKGLKNIENGLINGDKLNII